MKNILIIEDNDDIREGTAEILELSGYHVSQANNGRTGVEMALQNVPDLILCDIMMPELDGYGVLYMLSKNPATYTVPFIFLTAKAERTDLRKGMEMGADDYLTKPFDDIELLNAIESRLAKQKKQEEHYGRTLNGLERLAAGNGKGMAELRQMISSRKMRQIKKKQILFYDGDEPQGVYIVLKGSIKTFKQASDGRELTTGIYKNDSFLGLHAILTDTPFTDTAEAVEHSTVCLLAKDAVMDLVNRHPDIGQEFFKILVDHIAEKEEQLLELAYNSVRKRLAQTILRISRQSTDPLNFKASREELASMAGIALETVSRNISDFKDEGIIEKKGGTIQILDIEKLIKMKN
ncbi:response regulator [Mucilaginibacter daejeonensis]|uniref:response regulator n=1 Tax=Mucilaginibacter daejeonensis TaxID=398049 RepID=UPI001D17D16F|nr:response regulator [Mucilaginibacter daejeonensis]UEG55307.1 response regulator [Mucilaginibacter daejeonensis]